MRIYTSRELMEMIKREGWYLARTKGSHHIFKHLSRKGIVIIAHPNNNLPAKTIKSILKQAGVKIGDRK